MVKKNPLRGSERFTDIQNVQCTEILYPHFSKMDHQIKGNHGL